MDTDNFIVYIKADDKDIAEDVETRLENYELDRRCLKGKENIWINER